MADQKISTLDSASALTGAEIIEVLQSGGNKKSTISAVVTFLLSTIPNPIPSSPGIDGKEYFLNAIDTVVTWEEVIDANGTDFDTKAQLQAGDTDDWDEDDHYVGTTSDVITGTKGGMVFYGTDATSDLKYRYECVTDNNWYRVQRVIS